MNRSKWKDAFIRSDGINAKKMELGFCRRRSDFHCCPFDLSCWLDTGPRGQSSSSSSSIFFSIRAIDLLYSTLLDCTSGGGGGGQCLALLLPSIEKSSSSSSSFFFYLFIFLYMKKLCTLKLCSPQACL